MAGRHMAGSGWLVVAIALRLACGSVMAASEPATGLEAYRLLLLSAETTTTPAAAYRPFFEEPLLWDHARRRAAEAAEAAGDRETALGLRREIAFSDRPTVLRREAFIKGLDDLLALNRPAEVLEWIRRWKPARRTRAVERDMGLRQARALVALDRPLEAIRVLAALVRRSARGRVAAAAGDLLWELTDGARGRTPGLADLERLQWGLALYYQGRFAAARTVWESIKRGSKVHLARFYIGRSYVREEKWSLAEASFRHAAAQSDDPSTRRRSWLQLGSVLVIQDRLRAAREVYRKVYRTYPRSRHAAEAIYSIGGIYERWKKVAEAIATYRKVEREHRRSRWAGPAAFQRGRLELGRRRFRAAARAFDMVDQRPGGEALAEDAAFLRIVALSRLPGPEVVDAAEAFLTRFPDSYYVDAIREQVGGRRGGGGLGPAAREEWRAALTALGHPDAQQLRKAVRRVFRSFARLRIEGLDQPDDPVSIQRALTAAPLWNVLRGAATALHVLDGPGRVHVEALTTRSDRVGRGMALLQMGLWDEAARELDDLPRQMDPPMRFVAQLARLAALDAQGAHHAALRQAGRVRDALSEVASGRGEVPLLVYPRWLLQSLYPRAFSALIDEAARTKRLAPTLLFSLVRQESTFDPRSHSGAAARGLFQIIPTTARAVAREVPDSGFTDLDSLFDPAVSARLGAHYLRRLLDKFDGHVPLALAAYNAGPHRAVAWRERCRCEGDEGLLVASFPFRETRRYVKRILAGKRLYEAIYGAGPAEGVLAAKAAQAADRSSRKIATSR